jgi:hypothetical protein
MNAGEIRHMLENVSDDEEVVVVVRCRDDQYDVEDGDILEIKGAGYDPRMGQVIYSEPR